MSKPRTIRKMRWWTMYVAGVDTYWNRLCDDPTTTYTLTHPEHQFRQGKWRIIRYTRRQEISENGPPRYKCGDEWKG